MSKNVTEEQVEQAIEEMGADLRANPDPEAIRKLREEYGVTFDLTGALVEVKQPKRLRKAVKEQLEEQGEQSEAKGKQLAQSITKGASKTGEVILYGLVDAPVEGAKAAKQATKSVARNAASRMRASHAERLENATKRREARKAHKAARAEAKAEQAEAEATQESNEDA